MSKPHPDDDTRVQALIYAAVYDDEAAARHYGFTTRSLRNWRAEVRDGDTDFSETFRRYADALSPDARVDGFGEWMQEQVRALCDVFIEKARQINPNNPEGLRAIGEMTQTLLEHLATLTYLRYLFGSPPEDRDSPHGLTGRGLPSTPPLTPRS